MLCRVPSGCRMEDAGWDRGAKIREKGGRLTSCLRRSGVAEGRVRSGGPTAVVLPQSLKEAGV